MSTFAELRQTDFPFGANCLPPAHLAGGFVTGSLSSPRRVVAAEVLYQAFHELDDIDTDREAFGTVYQYPHAEYRAHFRQAGTPKGYSGPAACCRLVWDIDRKGDLGAAVADARTLARFLLDRYGAHAENGLGVYFSGEKGFHLALLALPGFHPFAHVPAVVKLLCLTLARRAGVGVDAAVYDRQRLFRLPNTRHPRTRLYKRFLSGDELCRLDAARIRDLARHPAAFAVPSVGEDCEQLADDWIDAEEIVLASPLVAANGEVRRDAPSSCPAVPHFVRQFIGFGDIEDPGRAVTLWRCAAALAEQGTPPAVVRGLLEEPALKMGLPSEEVEKQIAAGIEHGRKGASA